MLLEIVRLGGGVLRVHESIWLNQRDQPTDGADMLEALFKWIEDQRNPYLPTKL